MLGTFTNAARQRYQAEGALLAAAVLAALVGCSRARTAGQPERIVVVLAAAPSLEPSALLLVGDSVRLLCQGFKALGGRLLFAAGRSAPPTARTETENANEKTGFFANALLTGFRRLLAR